MPFDPNPDPNLAFGDPKNQSDWILAFEGQWFIGVLDTCNKRIYILPIDPRTPDARTNTGARNRNRYASGPLVDTTIWNSCQANWMDSAVGYTTHHKCLNHYHLQEGDCLGFTLIKLNRDGNSALLKRTSNSLNQKLEDTDPTSVPGHSFSRSTDSHAKTLPLSNDGARPQSAGLPHADSHVPGTTTFTPGTHCMGQGWCGALEQFFKSSGIAHIAVSMD